MCLEALDMSASKVVLYICHERCAPTLHLHLREGPLEIRSWTDLKVMPGGGK